MAQRLPATRSAPAKEVRGAGAAHGRAAAGGQGAAQAGAGERRPGPYRLGRSAAAGRAGAATAAVRCPRRPPSRPWRHGPYSWHCLRAAAIFDPGRGGAALAPASSPG